jgi:protein-tyrosine phosphatase
MNREKPMARTILFLCTGNYYRSRFAEEFFNSLAAKQLPDWTASSRALAIELGAYNHGPISTHARAALAERGIPMTDPVRHPVQCSQEDLAGADLIIALKEAEHRPYLSTRYPGWEQRVQYWHIHDLDRSGPAEALAEIAALVTALVAELKKSPTSYP